MSDFDDLIGDAENFQEEEEADDYFIAEYNAAAVVQTKKRALDDKDDDNNADSLAEKKVKPPGCLADYFNNTNEPFPQNDHLKTSNTSSTKLNNTSTTVSAPANQNSSQ